MAKQPSAPATFEAQLDKLICELDLSSRWGLPSILLAVYENTLVGAKAVSSLDAHLKRQGQYVCHIAPDVDGGNNIIDEITRTNHWEETVFFIMHLGCSADANIYETLNAHSDFFINNKIRVVYWLTKSDLADYVSHSPEYWFFQHKLVEFSSGAGWEYIAPHIVKRTWQDFDGNRKAEQQNLGDAPLADLLSLDIRDDLNGLLERARLLLKLGIFYFRQNEASRALQILEKAREIAAITGNAQFSLDSQITVALVQASLEHYDEAVAVQKKIAQTFSQSSAAWNTLASLYYDLFMFEEAIMAYQTALTADHNNPVSWQGLGEAYLQFGQLEKAIDAFHKAVLAAPNFAYAWTGLGKAYTAAGNLPKAVECYKKSLDIDYRQPNEWFEVGSIAEDDVAKSALQYALELQPTHAPAWNLLGNIYFRAQKFNKAIRAYYKAIRHDKDMGWPYANMALIYTRRKQYKNAVLLYIKSIQLFKNDVEKANALYKLGNAYSASGKYGNAVNAYREAGRLHKGSNLLDKKLLIPGPFRDWITEADDDDAPPPSAERQPDERPAEASQASAPVDVAVRARMRKNNKNAMLRKVLETNKKAGNVDYWVDLGSFYVRNRMYELAEDAFLIAIELDPGNGWPYYNLALANTVNGLYRDAVPLYEKSIRLFQEKKDKALSWNQLGNVYRRLNEPSLAVAAYEKARVLNPQKSEIVSRARLSLMSNCYAK